MAKKTHFDPSKRTPQEREFDLAYIARYYLRGWPAAEITRQLNSERNYDLSIDTVRRDFKELHKRWRDSYLVDFNEVKAKELARLDELEQAYWDGWEKSQRDSEDTIQSSTQDQQGAGKSGAYKRNRVEKISKQRDGTVSFLQGVERCITLRLKVFGLITNRTHVTMDWKQEAVQAGISESEAIQEFEYLVNKFSTALDGGDGEGSVGRGETSPE